MPKPTARVAALVAVACIGVALAVFAPALRGAQDPTLIVSTPHYPFGSIKMALDPQGNAYVAGSVTLKTACVMKITRAGVIAYTMCFSGTRFQCFSDFDCGVYVQGLAVDKSGAAYLSGSTSATDFPIVNQLPRVLLSPGEKVFAAKLSPSGSVVYTTYLTHIGQSSGRAVIAADDAGNAYVAGRTVSQTLPLIDAIAPGGDGFAVKIDAAGSALQYSTYLPFVPVAIAVDRSGAAYLTGATSTEFPVVRPIQPCRGRGDAFVAKINPGGVTFDYATCLGGTQSDDATGIAVDASGSAYVVGTTTSLNFPTLRPVSIPPHMGPLWKSDDGGESWRVVPFEGSSATLSVSSANPATWYVTSDGHFKSLDGGNTWRPLATPLGPFGSRGSLRVHPYRRGTVYSDVRGSGFAEGLGGFHKSTDEGEHWTDITATLPVREAFIIGFDPGDPQIVYATAGAFPTRLWKSVDDGATWTALSLDTGNGSLNDVIVDQLNGTLYAIRYRSSTNFLFNIRTLFRSTDRGSSWTPTSLEIRDRTIGLVRAYGSLYVSAGPEAFGDPQDLFVRSDDRGSTWQPVGAGLRNPGFLNGFAIAPSDPRVLYVANAQTLFISTDRGDTFTPLRNMWFANYARTITIDPRDPFRVFVGTNANSDAFVAKIAPIGGALEYSTMLGGLGADQARGISIDEFGRAVVFGSTASPDFPEVGAVHNRAADDVSRAFISVLDGGGSVLLFSSIIDSAGIHASVPFQRRIVFAGTSLDLRALFPGSAAAGRGTFIGMIDLSYGAGP